jgi:hypothetical protein
VTEGGAVGECAIIHAKQFAIHRSALAWRDFEPSEFAIKLPIPFGGTMNFVQGAATVNLSVSEPGRPQPP